MSRPFDTITVEQVARYPRPGMTVPGRLGFTPDSKAVTYLYSAGGDLVRSLWRYDLASGDARAVAGPVAGSSSEAALSREEELRRERLRLRELGVTEYQFASKALGEVLLVPSGGRLSVSRDGLPFVELGECAGAQDPRLSPDGAYVAFVRDGDLHVADVATGSVRRLTFAAEPGLTSGLAEFIAQEELDRARGFWWSPDSARVAFVEADERHIPEYPIVHQGTPAVDVERHRYPFAGEANARLRLGVVDVVSGALVWMDLGGAADVYLADVYWTPGGALAADVLSRDQRTLRLLRFDDGRPVVLVEEQQDPWLNLGHDTRFLASGEILRGSERTGYRHLFLHAADGALVRQLTAGEWVVTRLVGVDEGRRLAYVLGTRDGALERHLYAVPLDGGDVLRLTDEPGWHDAVLSEDGEWLLDTWSNRHSAPVVVLEPTRGGGSRVLFANEGHSAEALGLDPPELLTLTAADGVTPLDAALYPPPAMEPGRRYPLVVSLYGGPHAQSVYEAWALTVDLRAQYLARQGYFVLKVDNRGSANRGLAFEAPLWRHMGSVELEDQVAAVHQLVAAVAVDPERVGVYGWSYGGYMTAMAMFRASDVFRVGVAGAPVADWDGYDTAYTERYMARPQDNPAGYRESSLLGHVGGLRGRLLLVHGMVDENVHFRHTARLVVALAAAQRPYDLLLFPEERHMPRDAKGLEYQERRVLGYFLEHL
ncbi:MAG: DPP IV N-terminal domain-containing protein [Dehalococcoidia bacterium]|nr:DPP IV N-terminal domain-containing protein [Dehalococcoidia bacterium]